MARERDGERDRETERGRETESINKIKIRSGRGDNAYESKEGEV